jgi:hypothetical protein
LTFGNGQAHYADGVRNVTGLRFSESLYGYLGAGPDFWEAYRDGRARGTWARFWATVHIPDLELFLADEEHRAAITGRLVVAGLAAAPVDDGRIHMFCVRGEEKRLLYYLPFERGEERYLLRGEKRVHRPRGLQAWRQMTTLYTQLVRQGDGQPEEVVSHGVLRISFGQVVLQALSFRPQGTLNPLRAVSDLVRFLRFSSRQIWST